MQGGLAQVVERSIRIREAPRSRHGYSNWLFFTIIFIANFNASLLCQTEKVEEQKQYLNGDQLKWQSAGFAFERHRDRYPDSPISFSLQLFSLPIATQVFCAKQKRLENRKYVQGDQLQWQSARFAFERHRDRYPDSQISFSLQLFSLPIATQVFCAKQKRLENRTNMQGGLAQVVERSIRIRQAPGWRPGYSNWLFFTIIFIANFNASLLCQTEKVEEQKQCPRGISSSGRALDSHSRGTGIETRISNWLIFAIIFIATFNASLLCQTEKVGEQKKCTTGNSSSGRALDSHSRGTGIDTRILQLVFLYNYFRCQLQHKFFVPNRKGWRIEKMCKGDQLKWQSARFAFQRHRDRDTDNPIGYSLQLFSLPISTQVCCAKQKRLKNRNNI